MFRPPLHCRRRDRADLVAVHRRMLLGRLHGDGPLHITPGGEHLILAVLLPLKLGWIHFSERDHN